ncbi:pimeloyl-ACP methyl ester esterase BioH [Luteimonas sp. 50]|uniref:Pimeloyl-[acyl-carrier protein] methyl ester esterase n=1 Tax=Cognatiluteimonas sedimenti TaxID=2927791 RepID=A0ABT0A5W0_9GAMM|nr:pimeloyl-ACP methyl ester esterase BioH [Lysobacter sedimenti]MCJ0826341.1 pimeloyl-ACP methyl ester esterase BioH [Lysobacter sedimenti]
MHVEVAGSGPPLVLLHGWAMHGGVFAPLVERLRDRHTLHVVDLPGHGLSRDCGVPLALEPCVAAIAAQVPAAPWCGWSLGGLLALHAAARWPQRVPALAMLCASPRFVRAPDWHYGVSAEIFRNFAAGLRDDYRGTLELFVALEAFGSDHARDETRALRGNLFARGEPTAAVLADGLELLESTDLRQALPALQVPSLWLAGRRDRLVDPRAMRAAAALAPRAQVQVIEQAGHAPFLTHADEVSARLAGFLGTAA